MDELAAELTVSPIGWVRSSRTQPIDDDWDRESSTIELNLDLVTEDATAGLDGFSHVEVIYQFHGIAESAAVLGARHPRGNADWPLVGILAQRAKNRPNRLGVTCCRLIAVRGSTLEVSGLDAMDGTPVLDIKPWMAEFGPRGPVTQPEWSHELMKDYW
jgi:tRNA-Thr(GGU) m(6)t(6)A37 methyltransferase TsaA